MHLRVRVPMRVAIWRLNHNRILRISRNSVGAFHTLILQQTFDQAKAFVYAAWRDGARASTTSRSLTLFA
jgi:hypothetical protein